MWHDNIKFYDLCNYFEDATLPQLCAEWLKPVTRETIIEKSKLAPLCLQETLLTFEVASKFLRELQAIYFNNNSRKYDFHRN